MTITAVLFIEALNMTQDCTEAGPRFKTTWCLVNAKTCSLSFKALHMLMFSQPVTLTPQWVLCLAHSGSMMLGQSPSSQSQVHSFLI